MNSNTEKKDKSILRQLRALQIYAVVSVVFMAIVLLTASKSSDATAKFKEIEVGRINVVEPDGTLRLALFCNAQSPGNIMDGKHFPERDGKRGGGLMFFNDKGDECGGLTYRSGEIEGKPYAESGIMFDRYRQDQIVGLSYSEGKNGARAGLKVWDRPDIPLLQLADKMEAIKKMKDGPEKIEAQKKFQQAWEAGEFGADRVFVGKQANGDAMVILSDKQSKPRIVMSVGADGTPKLEFLDKVGKVIDSFPRPACSKDK
jgi:hypothetical protein